MSSATVVGVEHRFAFTGNARDYFRIWIVNLLLTVVTLGLWSAWAKVRKHRYFYGHTWVAGANFDYHGNPVAILRGRLIAAAAVLTYWAVDHLWPGAGPWLLLALLAAVPWIIARSLGFNAVNSSHRGIRFGIRCSARAVARAIWPIYLWPVALILVESELVDWRSFTGGRYEMARAATYGLLGLLYPLVLARVRRLTIANATWGHCAFSSALRTGSVYRIYILAGLLAGLIGGLLVGAVFGVVALSAWLAGFKLTGSPLLFFIPFAFGYTLVIAVVGAYTRSRMTNLVFATTRLQQIGGFRSTLAVRKLSWLYLVNLVAIIVTAGLLIPWAVIRIARYRAEALSLLADGPIDDVVASDGVAVAAIGEELAEAFGFDLAV